MSTFNDSTFKQSLAALKAQHGDGAWFDEVVRNDRFRVVVIHQPPGHANDWHYHLRDEVWFIAEGQQAWQFEGQAEPVRVSAGDFVYAPANVFHLIHVLGDKPAIRVAISHADEFHRHERANPPAPPRPAISPQ